MTVSSIEQFLMEKVKEGAFPGAAFAIGTASEVHMGAVGNHTYDPTSPVTCWEMRWDVASLTKVVATTSAMLRLASEGKVNPDKPVRDYLPKFQHEAVTVGNLLRHDSGLPAYFNFQTSCKTVAESRERLLAMKLSKPVGKETVYSCMGFCTLRELIEVVTASSLDAYLEKNVFVPLGMTRTGYVPALADCKDIPPTEKLAPWRKKFEDDWGTKRVQDTYIQGGVHDPAAFMMGGVSGNAGLFTSPADIARLAQTYLKKAETIWRADVAAHWTRRQSEASTRALGWDTKSATGSSAGKKFSIRSFGHTGYTGTSLWIDPENGIFACLLSNRVHPTSENDQIIRVRPAFHDLVFDVLRGP